MAHKWLLSPHTAGLLEAAKTALEEARDALDSEVADHRNEFDDMSEKWQEGERADAVNNWLDAFEDLVGKMDEAIDGLDDTEEEPDFP